MSMRLCGLLRAWRVVLIVILVFAVAHAAALLIFGHQLEARLAARKAAGLPVRPADLAGPRIPAERNGAVLYEQAFKMLPASGAEKDLQALVSAGQPMPPSESSFSGGRMRRYPAQVTPAQWEKAGRIVARHRPAIAVLTRAAARPECQFSGNWEAGVDALFPYMSKVRRAAMLVAAAAAIDARDGHPDRALKEATLVFRLGDALRDEPTMIGQLVRIATVDTGAWSLQKVLSYGDVSPDQALALFNYLGSINLTPGFVRAMQGETVWGLHIFDEARSKGVLFEMQALQTAGQSPSGFWSGTTDWVVTYMWRPLSYLDEERCLDHMDGQVKMVSLPWRLLKGHTAQYDPAAHAPWRAILARLTSPVFGRAVAARDIAAARIAGSRVLLALNVYHQYGQYPATLSELGSRLGWKLPDDPMSAKPLIYRREGKGCLLYSIGEDLKDGGGVPQDYIWGAPPKGDIVWRVR